MTISLHTWNLHLKQLITLGLQISRAMQQTQKSDRNNKLKKISVTEHTPFFKKALSRQETINSCTGGVGGSMWQ